MKLLRFLRRGSSNGEVVLFSVALLLLSAGAFVFWTRFLIRPRGCGGQLTACKCNLKNIGTGLEMYAYENDGFYPPNLALLTPNYLKTLPSCPTAGRDTYSSGYVHANQPGNPRVWCLGHFYLSKPPCLNFWSRLEREALAYRERFGHLPGRLDDMELDAKLLSCPYGGGALAYSTNVGTYLVSCHGRNHASYHLPADRPAYNDSQGLLER